RDRKRTSPARPPRERRNRRQQSEQPRQLKHRFHPTPTLARNRRALEAIGHKIGNTHAALLVLLVLNVPSRTKPIFSKTRANAIFLVAIASRGAILHPRCRQTPQFSGRWRRLQ